MLGTTTLAIVTTVGVTVVVRLLVMGQKRPCMARNIAIINSIMNNNE